MFLHYYLELYLLVRKNFYLILLLHSARNNHKLPPISALMLVSLNLSHRQAKCLNNQKNEDKNFFLKQSTILLFLKIK